MKESSITSRTSENSRLTIGILAHVDAGKTTLSEAILYLTGSIRKLGRVDHKTAFLDNNPVEQNRGITVFSKEARFSLGEKEVTLLDTPGHADFSAEMERTLQVLDYAILVISGADGVQAHTETLWGLLRNYGVPVFCFVNKMDQPGTDRSRIMAELAEVFGDGFAEADENGFIKEEDAAMCCENLMDEYLSCGRLSDSILQDAIVCRKLFPVFFGSALKLEGVREFLDGFERYTCSKKYGQEFGARVYKISRDKQGNRLTHMKITGGKLKSKMLITTCNPACNPERERLSADGKFASDGGLTTEGNGRNASPKQEKAEQIRIIDGGGFKTVQEAEAGTVCAVTGLTGTYAGQGLGTEAEAEKKNPVLQPAITCKLILDEKTDPVIMMSKLRQLQEEDPSLHAVWNEELQEIHVQLMGELEGEILVHLIKERFDTDVSFGEGSVIYKETIAAPVIGIGHYEPLRHYAEVHLLLEPLPEGSGLVLDSLCSEDELERNWQRLILTHLAEKPHPGVLTGAEITDMRISILAGRAHQKHTEGGDFRQATYRAVRQGLRKAETLLLEPFYSFSLKVPQENTGRALSDMQRLGASCGLPEIDETSGMGVIKGEGPVAALRGYQRECSAYTHGLGKFTAVPCGFKPCHNPQEVIKAACYRPEEDLESPTGSVFCQHGAAVYVDWQQVDSMAHVDSGYVIADGKCVRKSQAGVKAGNQTGARTANQTGARTANRAGDQMANQAGAGKLSAAGEKELEEIFTRTYGVSKRDEAIRRENMSKGTRRMSAPREDFPQLNHRRDRGKGSSFLIIDGYNVIFAWEELKELAAVNLDSAREAFLDVLGNYQGYRDTGIVVVFDGYKVSGNPGTKVDYGKIKVVYTKEAETADRFIERTVFELGKDYDVTVVTSDRLVQMAAVGDGARRMSAREFYADVTSVSDEIRVKLAAGKQRAEKNRPFEKAFKDQKGEREG